MYNATMGTSEELDEIKEAIRQFAKNFIQERASIGEKPAQLAVKLGRHIGKQKGFSRATMTEIQKDRRKIGPSMFRALAIELADGSSDKLEQMAVEWWSANKERMSTMRGKYFTSEKTYPNRGLAMDHVDGLVDTEAIHLVRRMRLEPGRGDLTPLEWAEMAIEEHHRLRHGLKSTPPPPVKRRP